MTAGEFGDTPPPIYWTIKAARYLRVAPWELADQPEIWEELALATDRAERAAATWDPLDVGD